MRKHFTVQKATINTPDRRLLFLDPVVEPWRESVSDAYGNELWRSLLASAMYFWFPVNQAANSPPCPPVTDSFIIWWIPKLYAFIHVHIVWRSRQISTQSKPTSNRDLNNMVSNNYPICAEKRVS